MKFQYAIICVNARLFLFMEDRCMFIGFVVAYGGFI